MRKLMIGLGICTAMLAACGGGGGGSDSGSTSDGVAASGVWRGSATLTTNNCNLVVNPQIVNFTDTVNQNGDAVVLDTDGGDHLLGNVVGDDGFSVDATARAFNFGNILCTFTPRIRYSGITAVHGDNNENSADVTTRYFGTCTTQAGQCELDYTGTAARNGAGPVPSGTATAIPTATVRPGATATPIPGTTSPQGACSSIHPSTYAGNLGCGLGSTKFSATATAFTLEPFGTNGLTTFSGANAGAQTITSVRSDLTIQDIAGYSCTIDCVPPSEFFVRCAREGGTSCTEKF